MANYAEKLKEKLLLLKQLGVSEKDMKYAKQVGENLDGVFAEMKEKLGINNEVLASMFSVFFHSEFVKVYKEKEYEISMMEEDNNEKELSKTMGWCYGELIIRFCKQNDNIAIKKAEKFKKAMIIFLPVIHELEKENPLALNSFYMFSEEINKRGEDEK